MSESLLRLHPQPPQISCSINIFSCEWEIHYFPLVWCFCMALRRMISFDSHRNLVWVLQMRKSGSRAINIAIIGSICKLLMFHEEYSLWDIIYPSWYIWVRQLINIFGDWPCFRDCYQYGGAMKSFWEESLLTSLNSQSNPLVKASDVNH